MPKLLRGSPLYPTTTPQMHSNMLIDDFNKTLDVWLEDLYRYDIETLRIQPDPSSWSLGQLYTHLIMVPICRDAHAASFKTKKQNRTFFKIPAIEAIRNYGHCHFITGKSNKTTSKTESATNTETRIWYSAGKYPVSLPRRPTTSGCPLFAGRYTRHR